MDKSKRWLLEYLNSINWIIEENSTLSYLKNIQYSVNNSYYRKKTLQIRKFLIFLKINWANSISLPSEISNNTPKRVSVNDIDDTLNYFNKNIYYKQIKAIIKLGISSGLRPQELYQLTIDDINFDKRTVHINHNPQNGQSTKTKTSRISFFNIEAKDALKDYLRYFDSNEYLKVLFSQSHITRLFKDAPIQVKDLRKYFSQEWDRRGGPTSIKKILMGHSLKGDVDLMHYNYQSEDDLKQIYDKVMCNGSGHRNIV